MSYRNDVDALAARHAALNAEVAEIAKQRDEAGRILEEARAKARLPVLDHLRIASPCSQKWADMAGDDRVRACAKCEKDVFNLSGMTRDEAEALIVERAGKLCVRYFQRADGTILLADCTVGRRGKRIRRAVAVGVAASLAAGVAGYALRSGGGGEDLKREAGRGEHLMGKMAIAVMPDVGMREVAGGASFEPVVPPVPVVKVGAGAAKKR